MNDRVLDPRLYADLKEKLQQGFAAGELMSPEQVAVQTERFRARFGPAVLHQTQGEALLRLMHGRDDSEARCLAYWLEFKNDEEFSGPRFGGIGGGSALKFGLFQRQADGNWIRGWPKGLQIMTIPEAVELASQQRDELVAGAAALDRMTLDDTSDAAYAALQQAMEQAAPNLSGDGWAHKYWFLTHPAHLDPFHAPSWQRFHLFKLLQMPPDESGIWNGTTRFICAGRFVSIARELETTNQAFSTILSQRSPFHRYWRVGTTAGTTGDSHWPTMRDGGFVSIGWAESVPDLSELAQADKSAAKLKIRDRLLQKGGEPGVAMRNAGQILNFGREIAENDIVLACEGQTVLGIGKVSGPYEYDGNLGFPHKLPVQWLSLDSWMMPEREGLRTTVYELGTKAKNLLEIERRLLSGDRPNQPPQDRPPSRLEPTILGPLDGMSARIDGILRRKGQVVLYGPPGTGKTFHALAAARELAARQAFHKSFQDLTSEQRRRVDGEDGLVRVCTFHPGYSYEDFIEGLRPRTTATGSMVFEAQDGIFKRLCAAAAREPTAHFFLVIDEINRGDLPRIFGELITVVELNKRDLKVTLPTSKVPFSVPFNVFLIGTMNTADRSISILDTAMRRRFGFIELMPDSTRLAGLKAGALSLGAWLDALNARLRKHLKRDARNLQIGHAYLMPRQPIKSVAEFSRILREDIVPLLEEYCYDDFQMLRDILGKELVDAELGRIREEMFTPVREADLISALSAFEELQSAQETVDDTATASEPEEDADTDDDDNAAT